MSQAQVRNDLSALGRVAQDPVTGKLTTAQLLALGHVVVRNGTATPTSVSMAIGMTKGAACRIVERLVTAGLVARKHDRIDKRVVLLSATKSGRTVQQRVADILGGKV